MIKSALQIVCPQGVEIGSDISDLVERSSVSFLALPDKVACVEVVKAISANDSFRPDIVVNFSTIGVEAARRVAHLLSESAVDYVDAPVSGVVVVQ